MFDNSIRLPRSLIPFLYAIPVFVASCSAVSTSSLRDAETLPAGSNEVGTAIVLAPNLFAVHDVDHPSLSWTLDPALFWFVRTGVTDRFELAGTMWASNIPFVSLVWGSMDLGLRGEGLWMVSDRASSPKIAIGVNVGGYGTGVGAITLRDLPHKGVGLFGMAGGRVLCTVPLGRTTTGPRRSSLTLGFQGDYLFGRLQFDPNAADSAAGRLTIERRLRQPLLHPSVTLRLLGGLYVEVGGTATNVPGRSGLDWTFDGGVGFISGD